MRNYNHTIIITTYINTLGTFYKGEYVAVLEKGENSSKVLCRECEFYIDNASIVINHVVI